MDVIPAFKTASRDFYLAYLNSPGWRKVRNRALKRAFYRCERCGEKRDIQVHHKTYERLGAEWDSDLEVLCRDHHEREHLDKMEKSAGRIYLKLARTVLERHEFDTIADLSDAVKAECAKLRITYENHQVEKALWLLTGGDQFNAPIPQTQAEAVQIMGRPLTDREAREMLTRLSLRPLVRAMPSSGPQKIDIYGAIPRGENWGDHDLY
jgi:hypothetical protein